jgi:hypothetical protein
VSLHRAADATLAAVLCDEPESRYLLNVVERERDERGVPPN